MPSDHGPPPGLTLLTLWLNCSTIPPNPFFSNSLNSNPFLSDSSPIIQETPPSLNKKVPSKPSLEQKALKSHQSLEDFLCPLLVPSPSSLVSFRWLDYSWLVYKDADHTRCLLFPRGGLGMRTASKILVEIELGQFCEFMVLSKYQQYYDKTSPQAKRHKLLLLFTSLTNFTSSLLP